MRPAIFIAAAILGSSTPAFASDDSEAVSCVRTKVWEAYGKGYSLRTLASSSVKLGETATWKVSLYPGKEYRFLGCGEKDVGNLDLILYGEDGKPVARDDDEGRQPVFTHTADTLGVYYLVAHVRSTDGADAPAEIAIAVTHK